MQHFVLFFVLMSLIVGLAYVLVKWPGGMHMTFSQHAAATKWSKIYYAVLFLVTLPLLFLFFQQWFVPQNELPQSFIVVAGVSIVFQILCTWFPEEGGLNTKLHRIFTGISGIALLPLVFIIATAPAIPANLRMVAWILMLIMGILLVVALLNQKGFKYALLLQIGYYVAFFGLILSVTYA